MSRARAWSLVIAATLVMTISYIDRQALGALAKVVCDDLHIGDAAYGWLGSAFSIAYLVGAPVAGFVLDRLGVRRGLVVSVLVWSCVAALHALVPQLGALLAHVLGRSATTLLRGLAPGFFALFLLRILLGLAEAPSFPGATQVAYRALPPEHRARGVGVVFTGSSIGAMVAPFVAVQILRATHSWQYAFLGTSAIGLLWVPLWLVVTRHDDARRALAAAPIVAPDAPPRPSALSVARHPALLRAAAAIVATAPVMAFSLIFGAKWLIARYDVPQERVDRYLWPPPLVFDACAVLFGFLAARVRAAQAPGDHRAPRLLFAIAMSLATFGLLAALAPTPATAVACGAIAAGGVGAVFAIVTSDLIARIPREAVSLAAGLCASAQSFSYIVASPLIGASVQATHGYRLALLSLGFWVLPGGLVWLLVRPAPRVD